MEGKKGIAVVGIVVFVIFSLTLNPVLSLMQSATTISNSVSIVVPTPLTIGLPSANVYVVRDDGAGNYVTINGSNPAQVLQTNTNPVTAINNAITNWVPINGKLVTNGTMPDWSGTVTPSHGNFTWEAWKTRVTQTNPSSSVLFGVNIDGYSYVTVNNFTYIGRNSTPEYGFRVYNTNYTTIENCTITGCWTGRGIFISGDVNGGLGHSVRFNNISNNYESTLIDFESVNDSVISNNTINCGGHGEGIGVFAYNTQECKNVNVTSNVITDWSGSHHAIYITGTAYSYVYNNTLRLTGAYGAPNSGFLIKSAYCYIYNNTVNGGNLTAWAFGMYQEGGGGSAWWLSPNGTMVYNNTIKNFGNGGFLLSAQNAVDTGLPYSIGNITITNNTMDNCHTDVQFTQLVDGPSNAMWGNTTVIGNSFKNSIYGVMFTYFSLPDLYTNSISVLNNTFTNLTYAICLGPNSLNTIVEYNTISSSTFPVYQYSTGSIGTTFRFNVGLTGYYMLNVTVVGSGSTSPSGLGWQYRSGSTVSVTWTPGTGYVRQNISIDGTNQSTTASPVNVTMSANHVVIAYFG